MTLPKRLGDLGIKNMAFHNNSLMVKNVCKLVKEEKQKLPKSLQTNTTNKTLRALNTNMEWGIYGLKNLSIRLLITLKATCVGI